MRKAGLEPDFGRSRQAEFGLDAGILGRFGLLTMGQNYPVFGSSVSISRPRATLNLMNRTRVITTASAALLLAATAAVGFAYAAPTGISTGAFLELVHASYPELSDASDDGIIAAGRSTCDKFDNYSVAEVYDIMLVPGFGDDEGSDFVRYSVLAFCSSYAKDL